MTRVAICFVIAHSKKAQTYCVLNVLTGELAIINLYFDPREIRVMQKM